MIDILIKIVLVWFACGLVVMLVSAYETGREFCEFKVQNPSHPVQIQFANLFSQMAAWPAVLLIKLIQNSYRSRLEQSIKEHNERIQSQG